ncbi:MAG: Ni/Fe hydrogenase subunit alpha [bacterium]|nr:Ni/Fe hydrogenase subunit alpha [bacterium]
MKTIKLDRITKVEGHAKLEVKVYDGKVKKVRMEVFEGARFFEGILKCRRFDEAPELTSRICGICSQAHMIASLQAVETILRVKVSEQTRRLRKLMLIAQIIQSHALHLYFLALPDYLGYESAISMAKKHMDKIRTGIRIKKLANDMVTVIGGREIHSVTPVVGGFSKLPKQSEMKQLYDRLKKGKKDAIKTAELFAKLKYPSFERENMYASLGRPDKYALTHGNIVSAKTLNIRPVKYKQFFDETVKPYSTAKFVSSRGKSFMVGALARINNHPEVLSKDAKAAIKKSKIKFPNYSPYINNFAQAVEIIHLFDRAMDVIKKIDIKKELPARYKLRAGSAVSVVEAPRGLLFHEYTLDKEGEITAANIIPPTTQNLKSMEDDIKEMLPGILHKPEEKIIDEIERLIRSYDPCISCSTHFLEFKLDRK